MPIFNVGKSSVVFLPGEEIIKPDFKCCHCHLVNVHPLVHNLVFPGSLLHR